MAGTVTVLIDQETGEIEIQVRGVKGKSCTDLTKALEEALGKDGGTKYTREYREAPETKINRKV